MSVKQADRVLGITLQGDMCHLEQRELWLTEKVMILDNKSKESNLKFRGIEECEKGRMDLPIFLGSWLCTLLDLEDGVVPPINKVGRANNPCLTKLRDIIVNFPDTRTKKKYCNLPNLKDTFYSRV